MTQPTSKRLVTEAAQATANATAATAAAADATAKANAAQTAAATAAAADATSKANAAQAAAIQRANHTGTQSADTLTDGTTNKAFLATERTKLTGITAAATANSADATLLARANHTGTQAASTVTGLATVATSGLKADVGLGNVDNTSDANKPVSTAQAAADATKQALQQVAATVTASGAAVVNKHNPTDATAAVRTISLPTGQAEGTQVSVEKVDSSTNTVSITGNIRGVAATTIPLTYLSESLVLRADSAGSWWPIAGHRTKSTLDAAYAPKSLPGALTGSGQFDPVKSIYNFKGTSLQKTRAQVGKAVTGTGLCEILCVGPSTTEGFPGSTSADSWPVRMVARLQGKGLPAGNGWVQTVYAGNSGTDDARWTFSSMTKFTSFKSPLVSSSANGHFATFTSTDPGTVIEWSIIGTWPAYSYQIDGGAVVPVTAGGGASQTTVTTITGLANTTHSVKLLAGATGMYVQAARVRNASGIQVTNVGYGGSSTDEWDTTVDSPLGATRVAYGLQASSVARGVPHLVIIDVETMMNDLLVNTRTTAQSSAALTRVVGQYQARGCDVVLTWSAPPSSTVAYSTFSTVPDATYQALRQVAYSVADALNVPLIDVPDRIGNWATANTNGLMADGLHPNASGYAAIGAAVEKALDL